MDFEYTLDQLKLLAYATSNWNKFPQIEEILCDKYRKEDLNNQLKVQLLLLLLLLLHLWIKGKLLGLFGMW